MTAQRKEVASRHDGGRRKSGLKGGYHLRVMAPSVEAQLLLLAGLPAET